jgi:hypothetical protein
MKRSVLLLSLVFTSGLALAKLPPLSDEAKAKAAEAAAKAAYGGKVANFQLCKAQDRVAAVYLVGAKKSMKDVQTTPTPPCTDPGPFVFVAPDPKPLEAAGAHSPPSTANGPPNTKTPAAEQAPATSPPNSKTPSAEQTPVKKS